MARTHARGEKGEEAFNLDPRALLRMTAREEEELTHALPDKEEVSSFWPIKSKQIM